MFRAMKGQEDMFEELLIATLSGNRDKTEFYEYCIGSTDYLLHEVVLDFLEGDVLGRTLWNGRSWLIVLPEMSEAGYVYRTQLFDKNGFSGHWPCKSFEELVSEVKTFKPIMIDEGALDKLSRTMEWRIGSYRTGLIRRINCGELPFHKLEEELDEFKKQLAA